MSSIKCPRGRETAIETLRAVIADLESGHFDAAFIGTGAVEFGGASSVNYARGHELGIRGVRVLVQVAPLGEVFDV